MKVKDIVKKINDTMIFIEPIEEKSGASFGYYKNFEILRNEELNNKTIKKINIQYFKNKRYLKVYF